MKNITIKIIKTKQNEKKQTAVEWVLQKILLENGIVNSDIEQVLKMEKEQHEMTFNEALNENSSRWFEKYYEETFEISFFIWR